MIQPKYIISEPLIVDPGRTLEDLERMGAPTVVTELLLKT